MEDNKEFEEEMTMRSSTRRKARDSMRKTRIRMSQTATIVTATVEASLFLGPILAVVMLKTGYISRLDYFYKVSNSTHFYLHTIKAAYILAAPNIYSLVHENRRYW